MPTVQFSLSSFSNKNADLKAGNTFTAYASGDGIANAMILAARLTLNNIRVYSVQCYLDLIKGGGTGKTANFEQNSNIHNQTVLFTEFSHALIQSGAGNVTFTVRASAGSTGNMINLRENVSGILEIDYFIPQSDYSLDKSEVNAGDTITATISPTHPNAEHETIWRFQTQHQNFQASHYDAFHHSTPFNEALTVPLDWLKAIPDTEGGTASITVDTYMNGVKTGTVIKYFSIKAGPGVVPNLTSLSAARINNGVPDAWGLYVQGISGVRLTGNGIGGIYDSWITEVKMTGGGYQGVGNPYDTGAVNAIGDVVFVCEVTESRGRKKTASVAANFVEYSTPQIIDLDVVRCLQNGTPDNSGEYVKVTPTYAIKPVNGHNGLTSMVTLRRLYAGGGYEQISTQAVGSGQSFVVGGGFNQNISYVVKLAITDTFNVVEAIALVPTQQFLLHYRYGGKGVAIGMIAQRQNAFEVNPEWEIYYKGMTLDQRFGGIDIPSIWPVNSGGTGLDNVPVGSYLKGNGVGALVPRTPEQVLADIGAAAASHNQGASTITAGTFQAGLYTIPMPAGALGSNTGSVNTLQIRQDTVNTDAFMTFHVAGDYAAHFGLDGTTNDLFYGGFSVGANKFRVYHAGNIATMKANAGLTPYGIDSIEFAPGGSAGHGGAIDFHFNGYALDYTSRIIEAANGALHFRAPTATVATGMAEIDTGTIVAVGPSYWAAWLRSLIGECGIQYSPTGASEWIAGVGHGAQTNNFVWWQNGVKARLDLAGNFVAYGKLHEDGGTRLEDKYVPKTSGTATWGQYLTGNSTLVFAGRNELNYFNISGTGGNGIANYTPYSEWFHILRMNHANTNGYFVDLALPFHQDGNMHYRRIVGGVDQGWVRVYDRKNITNGNASPSGGADGDIYLQW